MEVDQSKLIKVHTPHALVDGFPPVRHLMYCAEQIIIPQPFPNILKNYAKACIRTQPYDLLRWSAAYFRCLVARVPPPVKQRLERECRFGTLTRGYLRTLLQQLGKGFFVNRDVLQARWQSLSLPEDELLCFLSLCRMLHWPQVHWLKLFAVMVGSLNATLLETLTMLCELLTDEVEGSPSPIPMWMLRECYVFLAELDCGCNQRFENGRKVIGEDVLEDPSTMPDLPKLLSLESFRNAIVEKFNERLGLEQSHCRQDYPYRLDELGVLDASAAGAGVDDCADSATGSRPSTASSRPSHISSSFRFIGDYADATQVIKRTPDFDSVILLLHEAQGFGLHRYTGPHAIDAKTLRHAQRREAELRDRREHQARLVRDTAARITAAEHDQLLADIEPPWSWMHQFAAANCGDKSYNFLECQSIASDETPPESSDESFDFERSRFHRAPRSASDASCERGIEELLLTSAGGKLAFSDDGSDDGMTVTQRIVDVNGLLGDVMTMIERAVVRKQIDLFNTESVASFVLTNEPSTHSAVDKRSALNLGAIRVAIRHADEQHMVFQDLNELRAYLQLELKLRPEGPQPVATTTTTTTDTLSLVSADRSEHLIDVSPMAEPGDASETAATAETTTDGAIADTRAPLIDKFDDCQLEVEEKLLRKDVPGEMIIGIVGTPPATPAVVPTPPRTPTEPPSTPHDTTSGFITSDVSLHEFPEPYVQVAAVQPAAPLPREPFGCDVPPMAGIGAAVSKRTICNWVTYLTGRARTEHGLVFPRHFREEECPGAVDVFDT